MSYLRPYDGEHIPESSQPHPRLQTGATTMYSHPQQYHPQHALPTPPSSTQSPPYPTDHHPPPPPVALPKVGQIRCYWTMLSSDLQFIYLDPVLASHLEEQANLLVGKSLLSFIHPDERESAKSDLGSVLESRTVHGSVTRVRFSRLSKVRKALGYDGPPPDWSEAAKIVLDDEYMPVDLVINWAAEGLVLCFLHAAIDLDPNADNDERRKTGWTNWCGTPWMPPDQVETLYRRLLMCIPQTGTMSRVFQILSNERDRPLLLSWPPDAAQGLTSRDFAKLVENVAMGSPGGNDAKTSCTRRYKSLQSEHPVFGGQVESIFTPHGTIIFACHKVDPNPRSTNTAAMHQLAYASANYGGAQTTPYYDQGAPYSLPPLSSPNHTYNNGFVSHHGPGVQTPYSPPRWTQAPLATNHSNMRSDSYPGTSPSQANQPWPNAPPSATYLESVPPSYNRPLSPSYDDYSPISAGSAGTSSLSDAVPPPRRRISPGSSRDQTTGPIRSAGNRPMGVQKCSSCKATSSPEWRKGPSGKKELCNACGLRFARSRAKKEGPNQSQPRRRKEKVPKRDSVTPPSSISIHPPARRSYADSSFSTSSAGSASGSDVHPHNGHHVLDHTTPSPSPPASNANFVHYAPGSPNDRPPYSSTGNTFYPLPSPLSNTHAVPPQEHQQSQQQHQNSPTPLRPLGQSSSYASRLSTHGPPASPMSQSSLTSPMAPASYERERERERDYHDLPPTPLSAEPRHVNRRSILTQQ